MEFRHRFRLILRLRQRLRLILLGIEFSVFTFISSPTLIKLKQSPLLIKLRKSVFRLLCPPETGGTSAERGGGG